MTVKSLEDIKYFANWLVNEKDVNFHPDTPFSDYVTPTGSKLFSQRECTELEKILQACFEICDRYDEDIYEIMGLPLRQRLALS